MTTDAPPPVHPADLDDVLLEANEAHCAGDFAAAEQGYAGVLAASPGNFIVLNLLGALCGQTGRHQEAIGYLCRAAALRPSDPEIQRNLGVAHEMAGDLAQAAAQYARAVALAPNFAEAHFSLGVCHEAAGRIEAALASYRRAADLAPGHAPARNNLGSLLGTRDPAAAEAALRGAIALDPAYPEPRNNLGALLLSLGRAAEACPVLEEAVALRPGYADAMINLGMALCGLGRREEGVARLREAVTADPGTLPRLALAGMLGEYGQVDEAEALLRGVLAEEPGHVEAALALADLLHQSGHFGEAEALLTPFAESGPRRGAASLARVRTRRMQPSDRGAIDALAALAAQPDLPVTERVAALFALGKAHDDLGEPAAAMRALDAGNALQRGLEPRFDRAAHAAFVDRLIATYTPAFLAAHRDRASGSRRPLLIVGMIRSGTTLVEQMLAAHPAVAAGGELTFWAERGGAGGTPPADAGAAAALVSGYLAELDRIDARAPHVTDKLPHNVYAAGLIHMLFPHARILHCRRAPADVGLSLYRTLFATPHPYAYDQGDIVFLLRQYERLAAHWRAVLPEDAMLEVPFDALVTAPAATARRMLAFCGLGWDARVLDHAAHDRPIRTASAWQARQKVTAAAIGSAGRTAPWLGELAALLEPQTPAAG